MALALIDVDFLGVEGIVSYPVVDKCELMGGVVGHVDFVMVGIYRTRGVPGQRHIAVDVDNRAQARWRKRWYEVGNNHLHGDGMAHIAILIVAGNGYKACSESLYIDRHHAVAGTQHLLGEWSPLVAQQFFVEIARQETGKVGFDIVFLPSQDGLFGQIGLLLT